ncbi:MAG: protein kinase [bacterium]|nr:protein kinase [bacterium]
MAAAHEAGIVHRVKPANVMVTAGGRGARTARGRAARGRIKVLDFGIVKLMPGHDGPGDRSGGEQVQQVGGTESAVAKLTELGGRLGTRAYMAPEQLLDEPVYKRADVFAFGILVYEMLTGQRPFRGLNPITLADDILHGDPRSVRESERPPKTPSWAGARRRGRKSPTGLTGGSSTSWARGASARSGSPVTRRPPSAGSSSSATRRSGCARCSARSRSFAC